MLRSLYLISVFILICLSTLSAQIYNRSEPLAHTYSIVAYDSITGEMGVAVQSHWFSVGPLVVWGEAGVGVVATQSFVNPAFGPEGLRLMKSGLDPETALAQMIADDEGRQVRQVALLNHQGQAAAHTGEKCIEAAGHQVGQFYSVQANLMENDRVWSEMARAFEESAGMPLAERMLKALEAAQAVGGDIRGKQSAAMLVVAPQSTGQVWVDRRVDLRVDDHPEPIKELGRLLKVHRAYGYMNQGDVHVEHGDIEAAMTAYGSASELFPDNLEMKFWTAITLANTGDMKRALPMFQTIFKQDANWHTLVPRLVKVNLLTVSPADLERILALGK